MLEVEYKAKDHQAAQARLSDAKSDMTGSFCSNNMLALRVISDLKKLGHRVPHDLSAVGFDGIDAAS